MLICRNIAALLRTFFYVYRGYQPRNKFILKSTQNLRWQKISSIFTFLLSSIIFLILFYSRPFPGFVEYFLLEPIFFKFQIFLFQKLPRGKKSKYSKILPPQPKKTKWCSAAARMSMLRNNNVTIPKLGWFENKYSFVVTKVEIDWPRSLSNLLFRMSSFWT